MFTQNEVTKRGFPHVSDLSVQPVLGKWHTRFISCVLPSRILLSLHHLFLSLHCFQSSLHKLLKVFDAFLLPVEWSLILDGYTPQNWALICLLICIHFMSHPKLVTKLQSSSVLSYIKMCLFLLSYHTSPDPLAILQALHILGYNFFPFP